MLESSQRIDFQGYFFKDTKQETPGSAISTVLSIARAEDLQEIKAGTQDFFDNLEDQIKNHQIYIAREGERTVGYGIIERSKLYTDIASIGMIVLENERRKGYGKNILLRLKEQCYQSGVRPIAGCWYYNHRSKKTLETSGFYSDTRLIKAYF